ncbi:hypothetical protein KQX54_009761 [Cotesia glomerata]|uniref:Uncharacterized protein n=1 Tax=Cotesia glomerata TaxID=32391 RepID=A0AAV7J2R8_COTGL|nr:hypothetical protein KQX54_009761 [Cotesia glomerata]
MWNRSCWQSVIETFRDLTIVSRSRLSSFGCPSWGIVKGNSPLSPTIRYPRRTRANLRLRLNLRLFSSLPAGPRLAPQSPQSSLCRNEKFILSIPGGRVPDDRPLNPPRTWMLDVDVSSTQIPGNPLGPLLLCHRTCTPFHYPRGREELYLRCSWRCLELGVQLTTSIVPHTLETTRKLQTPLLTCTSPTTLFMKLLSGSRTISEI